MGPESSIAIDIAGLAKRFGSVVALDGLTLQVATGQVHGFLGPNGAGKSTTIRVLLGLLRADGGSVRVLGEDPWGSATRLHRRLAYVPADVSLWPNLSGGQIIDLLGRSRGGLNRARRAELIEVFELDPTKKGRSYSTGNRQKVALIAALASDVELLLLDEPTSGLDPLKEQVFNNVIRGERERGRTVLLSSHILSEVEALCDHVSIIKGGALVQTGSLGDLRHLSRTHLTADLDPQLLPDPFELSRLSGVYQAQLTAGRLTCQVDNRALVEVLAHLARYGVRSLVAAPPTLEELFLRHYERSEDVEAAPLSGQP